jgi:uncharacterized membrane protein YeiB
MRVAGIDVARAVAIIGMITVHISPSGTASPLTYALAVPRGRSAILFGLLAGIGVSLLASSRTRSPLEAQATLLWRAAVLLPLGLWLQALDHDVFVILADYAVLYLLAVVVLRWPDRWLLLLAGLSATVGSWLYLYGTIHAPQRFVRSPAVWGDPMVQIVDRLVLSGPYPLVTWAAPFCVGVWLGRRDLVAPRVRRRLLLVGGPIAVAVPVAAWLMADRLGPAGPRSGWWQVLDDVPHRQMPLWLLSATASAVVVLGLSLWLAERAPRASAPLAAAGRLAFTWYVLHLLVLHAAPSVLRTGSNLGTIGVVIAVTLVMTVASVLWLRVVSRGPLEVVLQPPWRRG